MDILRRPTLVLNRNWQPISTVTVQDAVKMLHGDYDTKGYRMSKANVLDIIFHEDESWDAIMYDWDEWAQLPINASEPVLHAGSGKKFRVPEIVIASRYQKVPKNQDSFNRRNLFRRDSDTCQYCGKKGADSIDHVWPKSKGGKNNWENCVVSCFDCNQKKKDMTLQEANMKLLREPTKPGLEILGQSRYRMKSWSVFFNKATEDSTVKI